MPERVWHAQVVDEETLRTLAELNRASVLQAFYLAGGTGIALRLGHRRSRDLDLFTPDSFGADEVIAKLRGFRGLKILEKGEATLHATMGATKLSFLHYPYPLLFPAAVFHQARVADLRDIAGMKLSAIAGRGTRRDFIDLHAVAQQYGLPQILKWFDEKFRQVHYSRVHLLKSLTFFEDARKDPMPEMLAPLAWSDVEKFFSTEVLKLI
jgi:hypothetical protein